MEMRQVKRGHDVHDPAHGVPADSPTTQEVSQMKDPVCGMTVDPRTAKHRHTYGGETYFFCCPRCVQKFLTPA